MCRDRFEASGAFRVTDPRTCRTAPTVLLRVEDMLRTSLSEPYDPMWVEEPVQFDDLDGLAQLQEGTTIPLATGERMVTRWQFHELIARRCVEIIQPDVITSGGI